MKIKEVYKALTAGATTLAGMEGLVAILAASEHPWVHAAAGALSLIVGGATWFVRNKATFDQIADALDGDADLAAEVGTRVAQDPVVVEQVVKKNPDLVEDLIRRYRDTH